MSARYLLDTNIVSYLLRNQFPILRSRFDAAGADSLAVSSITEAEVFFGIARRPGAARLKAAAEEFFVKVPSVPWDSSAARAYGLLRAELESKGKPLSAEDLMIAAQALALGLTLVTRDVSFSLIDDLKTEDWTVA